MVLAGYDDSDALLSDTGFEELQTTALPNLAKARHSKQPIFQLEGHVVDLPQGSELDAARLREAVPAAVARAAREMLEPSLGDYQGMPALERFADEVASWPEAAEDWQWCARFLFQVIERRGTGGGNFRAMYSRFLEEAGYEQSPQCAEAARLWTASRTPRAKRANAISPMRSTGRSWAPRPRGCATPRASSGGRWPPRPNRRLRASRTARRSRGGCRPCARTRAPRRRRAAASS